MFPNIKGSTQQYLADLQRNETFLQQAQGQVSSGLRVQQASDDPAALSEILQTQTALAHNQQIQTNLGNVKTEVDTADSALQTAVQAIENAISLASQGATSTATTATRSALAQQIAGLQQTLIGVAQTQVNGRYIFSGDQDSQPPYVADSTQPNGVSQVVTGSATRMIQSVDGTSFAVARTAQQIFDARNPDGTPADGNVFAAIQALQTALTNNDTAGVAAASDSLKSADSYVNGQASFYGEVENRIQQATGLAQKFQIEQQTELSNLRDTDIPTVATEISQLQIQQQASLSVEANVAQMKNLFSLLA